MNKVWSESEINFIRLNAHRMKDRDMVAALNKIRIAAGQPTITKSGLTKERQRLGLAKKLGRPPA